MAKIGRSKKKLSDYVLDEIKRMIVSGEIKEGDKLPNQNDFAAQLGVSRLPLREAMQRLSQMGVIEEKPGSGTRIISADPDKWNTMLEAPFLSDAQSTLELLEARRFLETNIIHACVQRFDAEDIHALRKDIQQMEKALKRHDTKTYLKNDMAFHFHIARATHNRYLLHMLQTLQKLLEQFMMEVFSEIPNLLPNSLHHHEKILSCVEAHDMESAAQSMNDHLANIVTLLIDYYREKGIRLPEAIVSRHSS